MASQTLKLPIIPNFAAIDFETANNSATSICSVGIVFVKNHEIVGSYYSLVRPVPNFYCYWNTKIHGLKRDDTDDAPYFTEVWKKIHPMLKGQVLLAHNSSFDENCLKLVCQYYNIRYPNFKFYCTYRASLKAFPDLENHQLHTVAAHCGFDLTHHHNALADAEACAHIGIKVFS